jgi:hypothetical protein
MAKIFPTLENIKRLKIQPTEGEWFLINYLVDNFDDNVEIFVQAFLNGDRPDIILIQKNVGVTVIEVKDWNLESYLIDENNKWHLKKNRIVTLKSPFQQVFDYKNNFFNLHINGLLDEKLKNKQFYGRIMPYVYFHKVSKKELVNFYAGVQSYYRKLEEECHQGVKSHKYTPEEVNKRLDYIKQKKSKFERDIRYCAVCNDELENISLPKADNAHLFKDEIYQEFKRLLQPPYHVLTQGKEIKYSDKQEKLIVSRPEHKKISGVAGSGKTVVLAKRAVNAHKRHNHNVLILTYNITLKSYIHDKISDVREDFSWGVFYVTNYHQFINQELNNLGISIEVPEEIQEIIDNIETTEAKNKYLGEYFDKKYYSNQKLFDSFTTEIHKYESVFIDEIQDYKPEWIKIIREYFLEKDSEMVLFGDEKQNIYERELDVEKKPKIVQGFGRWEKLNKSIRHQGDGGRILSLAKQFQYKFFKSRYEVDSFSNNKIAPSLNVGMYKLQYYNNNDFESIVDSIYNEIRERNIHPNDVAILSSRISELQVIDRIVRTKYNEKTLTTFEQLELSNEHKKSTSNIRRSKKIGFNLNSGVIKISTIHSFKGYEIPNLFLIIHKDAKEEDHEEVVYTGITRSKFDIMIFTHEDSQYNKFFENILEIKKMEAN